ncbi:hypothetical protein [Lysobacter gummosus]
MPDRTSKKGRPFGRPRYRGCRIAPVSSNRPNSRTTPCCRTPDPSNHR